MSDENKRILSNQYRQLPRIESPDHLDQKILQEARKCTADNKIKRSYGWTPALAAACLVGVAFYIATPNYDVDSYRAPEPNVAVSFEAIEERSQAADLVAESEVMTPNSAAPASSSPS
nr:hypothetical protein [Acidiferrobacterales bacterium]